MESIKLAVHTVLALLHGRNSSNNTDAEKCELLFGNLYYIMFKMKALWMRTTYWLCIVADTIN